MTTGSSPATIVYAVQPPKGLVFKDTPSSSAGGVGSLDIIVNSSGEFSCSVATGSGSPPSCQKLGKTNAASQNRIFDFYTPSHWIGFLRDFSLAAGFAGDKVTSSNMTVNGFAMSCVDFRARGSQASAPSARPRRASSATSRWRPTRQARDQELLVIAAGLPLRAATGRQDRHGHDSDDLARPPGG